MSDLIHQLRQGAYHCDDYRWRAADELELLRKENERLRAALLVARKYVLVQLWEWALKPEDAERDLDVIDEALEEDDD